MEILKNKTTLQNYIERQKEMGKKIGFAPTMGALHDGHLSLYKAAKAENDLVISSIFVNPTQFNNVNDLAKYPRTLDFDIKKLEDCGDVDAVYIPQINDIYPEHTESKHFDFDGLEDEMEGKFRPGHFDGVATVVEELFKQVKPDNAYFGEKDFQQLAIIKKLAEKLKLPIHIHGVAIFRNSEGLALSSRNERLTSHQKKEALILHDTLIKVNEWFRIITIPEINKRVVEIFAKAPAMELEYFTIANEETLKETDFFYKDKSYRAFLVVNFGDVRLIDNMHLE
ncbi:pantoate--beta-alanine ligase [Halpernia sp.]|uniref:pantoate--beta-alanine ligase n=1 Tax=Halpernia sp. TaxID=2782209 RepID=UPI003A948599